MDKFVLKGHICYSEDTGELITYEKGYIVCVDGKSHGVYEVIPKEYQDLPIIDYGDKLIIPGLVDLHIHAPQFAYRGMGMDLELMDWLAEQAFPEETKYADLDYAKKAYSIFADALKKSATTRACIFATRHREATELLMELMEESGLVTFVGKVNMDRDATKELVEESAEQSARDTIEWLEKVASKYARTKPILTPRFIPCCTDELMNRLEEIQARYGLPVQSHLSENQDEIELVRNLRPNNPFYGDGYNQHNMFGKNNDTDAEVMTIMAHSVWSEDAEVELMKENGVFVAHCPASNMNLASGIAPVRKYLDKGLNVGLGSDVAGGHSESIFRAISDTVQVSKMYWRLVDSSVKPVTFSEAFYLATKGGGAFFGQVGSFEIGYEFDAVVLDDSCLPHPQELTVVQRLERAVYLSLDIQGICAKYVAGQLVASADGAPGPLL